MFEEAKNAFGTSLILDPFSFEAGFNLAKLASQTGDTQKALEYLENAKPYVVILAAASFMYIAIADLLPRLKLEWQGMGWHALLLAAGIGIALI
jgi:hypothetical protein